MIQILYTKFTDKLPNHLWEGYMDLMPKYLQNKNIKYRRWQDRHAHLLGKLLLLKSLDKLAHNTKSLVHIKYNDHNRPYLDNDIDFNISHSEEYVICAIGSKMRVGVDIEKIKEINFEDFNNVMTVEQWQIIKESPDPYKAFFKFWTIKESVIKADSRGLTLPLLDLHVNDNRVDYDNKQWHLTELNIDANYAASLATDIMDEPIKLMYVDFFKENVMV